jgi:hypothetical protein
VDGSFYSVSRNRDEQLREEPLANLPRLEAQASLGYARVAWGDPDDGVWGQAIAASQRFTIRNADTTLIDSIPGPGGGGPNGSPEEPDTLVVDRDTTMSAPQYVVTGGVARGPWRLSATGRLRRVAGRSFVAPSLRASLEWPRLTASAYLERSTVDRLVRAEVTGRALPLPWLALGGGLSRFSPTSAGAGPTMVSARAEAGVRLGRMWLTAGVTTRDTTEQPGPIVFDTAFRSAAEGAVTGTFATIGGKFYRDVGLDVHATRYPDAGPYRPQYHAISRIYVDSDMRARFPSGNLHILLAVTHEYRSQALFPTSSGATLESTHYRAWGLLLEIRLLTETLSYQFRNFLNEQYQQVP